MNGNVGVTVWWVVLESMVAPGNELEGHGEDDKTIAMRDSLAYKGCSEGYRLIQSAENRRKCVPFGDVTSLKTDISKKGKSPSSAQHI